MSVTSGRHRRRRRLRKGLKRGIGVIPSLLTVGNLVLGFGAVMVGAYAVTFFAGGGDREAMERGE